MQPQSIGTFFDGTGNDGYRDGKDGKDTNVFKLNKLYLGEKIYLTGVGTSEKSLTNPICQATGCGASNREQTAMEEFIKTYKNFIRDGNNQPFIITDTIGFRRGAATARDYSNRIITSGIKSNDTLILPEFVILRSILPFDTVSSFGAPWNGVDIGKNFTTNPDTIVIHPIAEDERRTNFGLQSIKPSPDAKIPSNWIEQSFPGVHSTIGNGYKEGEQGKSNDIGKYVLNWVVNNENKLAGEKIFNTPSEKWQPSARLNDLMNFYLESKNNGDQSNAEAAKSLLKQNYIHDNVVPYNPAYWSFGPRNVYYPNQKLESKINEIVNHKN